MVDEYSDSGQRSAVCNSSYNSYKEDSLEGKEEVREDVFTTEEEALERAEEIGCSGTHTHDDDGNLVFMPCSSHADYTRLTGRELSGYGMGKKPKKKKPWPGFSTRIKLKTTGAGTRGDLSLGSDMKKNLNV